MSDSRRPDSLHRRGLLFGASAAGLALAGLPHGRAFAQTSATPNAAAALTDAAWNDLATRVEGPIVRPSDFDFAKVSRPKNLAHAATSHPVGIAYCTHAKDVQAALKWCTTNNVPLVARAGGHSYGGFSTLTGGLIVDVSLISSATYNTTSRHVTVGGGARNGSLYALLRDANAAVAHGCCPTVGAAGFLLGGGIGFNMRAHGIAVDHLESTELITASGDIVTVSRASNRELFWACRGAGGGNFGINTKFVLRTFPAEPILVFVRRWTFETPQSALPRVAEVLMRAFTGADPGLGSRLSLKARNPRGPQTDVAIELIGQFRGGLAALERLLGHARDIAKPQYEPPIERKAYWDGQAVLEDDEGPSYFHERSAFLSTGLDGSALNAAYYNYLFKWPGTRAGADLKFFQTGGKMNHPDEDTAFIHRSSEWLMVVGLGWTEEDAPRLDENVDWQNCFYAAMLPHSQGTAYQNFIDPAETGWAEAYYGNALPRLRKLKREVDAKELFKFPQSIPPAS